MKKTVAEIDPAKPMNLDDFFTLFSHLPLTEDEKIRLKTEYFSIYTKMLRSDVDPTTAWLATRQIFYNKEQQIGKRKKSDIIGVAGEPKNRNEI